MENKILVVVITATISLIVLASILVPALDMATDTHDTFKNDDYYITMDKIDSTSSHVIEWTQSESNKLVVDGVDVYPDWSNITIVAEEDNLVRSSKSSGGVYYMNFMGADRPGGAGFASDLSMTVTIEGGVLTFSGVTSGNVAYSMSSSFTEGYIINPTNTGDYQYVMKTPTAKAYVHGDSEIYGIGFSTISGQWNNVFRISGTIKDGIDVDLISSPLDPEPTISNVQTYSEAIDGYIDAYQFEKVTFTASYDGTDTALTYSFVIVPAEITAEKSVHLSDGANVILKVIPGLLIVAVLLGVSAIVIRNKLN